MKHVKTIGAVICMTIDHSSRHLAVGSDQGNVRYFSSYYLSLGVYSCLSASEH